MLSTLLLRWSTVHHNSYPCTPSQMDNINSALSFLSAGKMNAQSVSTKNIFGLLVFILPLYWRTVQHKK